MTPIPILLYHAIAPQVSKASRTWSLPPTAFAEHIAAINQLGYTCLTISDLLDAADAGSLPARPLAITFDDGRRDFSDHAYDILSRYAIPSTMYVPTAFIGATSRWFDDAIEKRQPMMSWQALRDLPAHLVELGAHSVNHVQLDVTPLAQRRRELCDSRQQLADGLQRDVRSLAYPHGYHSASVRRLAREAGFDSGVACGDRWSYVGEDRFAISRFIIRGATSADALVARLADPPSRPGGQRTLARLGWRLGRRVQQHLSNREAA